MGFYKRLNGLGKSVKFGLVGVGFYLAAALVGPVYSAVKQEVVPQVKLEQVVSVEQADSLYNARLREYSGDKLLDFKELQDLYKIEIKRKGLLGKQKEHLTEDYDRNVGAKIKLLDGEIEECKKSLANKGKLDVLAKTRGKLQEQILNYYPTLIDKNRGNIVHSAETIVEAELNPIIKNIITEADQILKQYYNDNILELLSKKNKFNLNNILAFYYFIQGKDDYLDKTYEAELKEKLESLELQKSEIINLEQNLVLENKLKSLEEEIRKSISPYGLYFDQRRKVEEFESKYGNFNKEFSVGGVKRELLGSQGLKDVRNRMDLEIYSKNFESENERIIPSLESCFSNNGLRVEGLGNPARTRLPWWLGTFVLGFGFPFVRNLLVKGYVKGSDADGDEYAASGVAGVCNGMLGIFVIDGLHPLVYPARMLSPLVLQPIFKVLKVDPCKWLAENF